MRVAICQRCGDVDDPGDPVERVLPQRCPCPHDELTVRTRIRDAEIRHYAAVARAKGRNFWEKTA